MSANPKTFSVLDALKACPYTSYKIASETGITQASIQNYRTGRSRPSPAIVRVLEQYFKLEEYRQSDLSYIDFFEEFGVNPLVEPRPSTVGLIDGYTPKQKDAHVLEQPSLFPQDELKVARDETTEIIVSMNRELETLHSLVLLQRERLESQEKYIVMLRDALYQTKTS